MALTLHRAQRADLLAEALADVLREPQADPFARELVIVPARGIERWLSQRLSHRLGADAGDDGVCAAVDFRTPRSLVAELTGIGDDDPWSPDVLVWTVLEVIDSHTGESWMATLDAHLGRTLEGEEAELRHGRRYAVARRLAGLFASYAVQRPSLLTAWAAGQDDVDPDLAWQPELWRHVLDLVDAPPPAERHAATLEALAAGEGAADLPPRLSLFGHTRIAATEAELLGALGRHRDVHVWLPHPSEAMWTALSGLGGAVPRDEDRSHERVGHPLLASLGRDVRELQRTLEPVVDVDEAVGPPPPRPGTLLGLLQSDLAASSLADASGRQLEAGDRSVQVHACHGPARQVDVLREVILGLLADDPSLEPRDVLVMCPDIEAYAPLVEAAFGLGSVAAATGHHGWHPGHALEVRLADRALTRTNPLLAVVDAVLTIAGGRAEASAVLDLCATDPVRRRFGFSDDDLDRIGSWVDAAGIRWAFDAEHRRPYGLERYVHNTWRFGLDRVLAGVAVSDDANRWIDTTLPLDDVGSTSIDLAGRLAELVDRLHAVTERMVGSHPVTHWLDAMTEAVASLTSVAWGEEWQTAQVQREIAALGDAAGGRTELRLPDVRALLAERLAGRPTRANFRSGSLTVCTMVPMRSVPHRVVCLLGLDDDVFPRNTIVDGDDALARRPVTGERDPRSEDRQLLLDAVMAATEHLVVTYSGAQETTGQTRPPAVPLGELLDALDATVEGARHRVVVHHPLQPFDQRNLVPGVLQTDRPFSFDPAALAGARAAAGPRRPVEPFVDLPALPPADVDLADLGAFLRHPVRAFLSRRMGIALPEDGEEVVDVLPLEIDSLAGWSVGDRLLRDVLAGTDLDLARQKEWRRGTLPPGRQLGWQTLTETAGAVAPVAAEAIGLRGDEAAASVDVDVDLGDGRRLRGTVSDVYGSRRVEATYSKCGPRHYLDAWLPLLALCATRPDVEWHSGVVGRGSRDQAVSSIVFGPVEDATEILRQLVALHDAGMRGPVPLPLRTGHAWATKQRDVTSRAAAAKEWTTTDPSWTKEDQDPHHVRVWGRLSFDELLAATPRQGEGYGDETTRLGALSRRLWQPILDRAAVR
ncbi:exodeoxyribonuclease V subunit gamma [Aeromicrobium terrae]|uniref:RecBCD enzyme subunit RecC n=1 Tax=Aeromicrobium terrae TaxID=2498846 RepID=A0A5C8NNM7_9ACTN|nr:exodeoxyribonuclease V subunit gamma [Aeromicrobium terrae]TXL62697.1 exodeoxyribonuclease V subunit gamma [Aeromicrobium terrae]